MLLAVGLPVLRTAGPAIAAGVTSGSRRSTSGPGARRTRALLVSLQTAMTMMLLSAGALVVLTLDHSSRTDPGMDPHNVVTAQLRLAENAFPTVDARAAFIERVLANVRAVPDVVSAGTTMNLFTTGGWFQTLVHVEDRPTANGVPHTVQFRRVSPGLFGALGMTIRRGRDFDAHDTTGGQPVAIVSRAFAHRFWPGEDPIGKRVKRGSTANAWSVVVGEVNDVRDVSLDQRPGELVYVPVLQNNAAAAPVSLVVRTASNPGPMVPAIKRAVWAVDPQQPLGNVITLDEFLSDMLGPQRLRAILIGLCGLLGLVLAIIGTYGMTARSVSERQREIGIRLALGGSRTWVWWAMAMSSVRAVGGGVVCGVVLSAAAAKGLSALIPDLQGGVVATSAVLAAVLITTGVGAALCAAHSAARVELLSALRSE
jgi:predicted permease